MTLERLWPLALIGLMPWIWWMRERSLTNFSRPQRTLQAGARSAVICLLAFALAEPALIRATKRISVAFVLDTSASVSPTGLESAVDWIRDVTEQGRPDHSILVVFGANTAVGEPTLASFRELQGRIDGSGTNIGAALDEALRNFPPHSMRRLVLISDGQETAGDLLHAVARLRREGVRVYSRAAAPRAGGVWLMSLRGPDQVAAGERFRIEAEIHSQTRAASLVELRRAGERLEATRVTLDAGANVVTFDTKLDETGPATLEVVLQADRGEPGELLRGRHAMVVTRRATVLYVEGHPEQAHYLTSALRAGGYVVDLARPAALPARAEALQPYDLVILSDVAPNAINIAQMEAVAGFVDDLGGGLVFIGGEAIYGADGYSGTPLERILPVNFRAPEEPKEIALVMVLDKSWSMAGQKIELAKEAAKAAVTALDARHRVGLFAFNHVTDEVFPVERAVDKQRLAGLISAIEPGSLTNIYPALERAHDALVMVPGHVKHVILLSDGRSYPDKYEQLVRRMADAGITVSSVAVGDEADRELLANIADWGRGRAYAVDDPAAVPQIFVEETERTMRPALVDESTHVVVRGSAELLTGLDIAAAPPLGGYVASEAKDTAQVIIESAGRDPMLARWQYGLGRAVFFASDAKNRWAAEWLRWSQYGPFWTQLVRETSRKEMPGDAALRVTRHGDRALLAIDMADSPDGRFAVVPGADVTDPRGETMHLEVRTKAPGRYEAALPLRARGDYIFRLWPGSGSPPIVRALAYDGADEFRSLPADEATLRAISQATGGTFDPRAKDIFERGDTVPVSVALWRALVAVAAVLYLLDLWLRRVRLFEAVGRRNPLPVRAVARATSTGRRCHNYP